MTITADLFEAYLKCPMKCWLRAKKNCEAAAGNAYSEWAERQAAAHRSKGIERLFAAVSETECAISLQKEALTTAKCRLAANVSVSAEMRNPAFTLWSAFRPKVEESPRSSFRYGLFPTIN